MIKIRVRVRVKVSVRVNDRVRVVVRLDLWVDACVCVCVCTVTSRQSWQMFFGWQKPHLQPTADSSSQHAFHVTPLQLRPVRPRCHLLANTGVGGRTVREEVVVWRVGREVCRTIPRVGLYSLARVACSRGQDRMKKAVNHCPLNVTLSEGQRGDGLQQQRYNSNIKQANWLLVATLTIWSLELLFDWLTCCKPIVTMCCEHV